MVYVGKEQKEYEGQYVFEENNLKVEIVNYYSEGNDVTAIGEEVKYKEIKIVDLRNKVFAYSPVFYNVGVSFALTQYETFQTDFYFISENVELEKYLTSDIKISGIILYHPALIQCFKCKSLQWSSDGKELVYKIIRESEKDFHEIKKDNVDKIEFGSICRCSNRNSGQSITIDTENFVKIYLEKVIDYESLLQYINEFDIYMNVYCPINLRSYKTEITTDDGKTIRVMHRLLGEEKYYAKHIFKPVKENFFEYIKKMYTEVNYRSITDRNKYIPIEFKKPTSLEDQYTFYFRYIDLYMGDAIMQDPSWNKSVKPSNYQRLSTFVDQNIQLFDSNDVANVDNLKNELNSLRNQYIHEGYYLPNNQFDVKNKKRQVVYTKVMDYGWLMRMVNVLKLGSYLMLYREVLSLDTDEGELRNALKIWM